MSRKRSSWSWILTSRPKSITPIGPIALDVISKARFRNLVPVDLKFEDKEEEQKMADAFEGVIAERRKRLQEDSN